MSKFFQFFQEAIKSCNVFNSPVNLRYKLNPDYNTFAGGVASIILILLLVSVFFNSWMVLLNKQDITSSTQVIREMDPSHMNVSSDDFMFTIGVIGMNLSDISQKKYFDLKMAKYEISNVNGTSKKKITSFQLEPCTANHWQQLGSQFVDTFHRQGLSGFLCVPRNTTINLSGKYTSEKFIYYKFTFQKCIGKPYCRTQAEIDAWVVANVSFYFNFYYSNTLLNPDQQQPISMFFQDKDYMMFSPTMATSTNIYLGQYKMDTDESLFPWNDKQLETGFIINRAEKQSWNYMSTPTEPYCKFYLRKSNIKFQIQRKFRKIDDMLSYIGGLFGIIAVAVGFIMKYYGQCSFELQMCQKIFNYHNRKQKQCKVEQNSESEVYQDTQNNLICQNKNQRDGQSNQSIQYHNQQVIEPKDFGIVDFFLHTLVYAPLKKICNIKWRRMQIYGESLEEMRYKLDISQLLEKLTFYDRSINTLFDENQLKLLYLQEKFNFQEVRQERNMLGLRKNIIANLFGQAQQNMRNPPPDEINQKKKSLKQIALRKSRSKIQTFVGAPSMNLFQIFANSGHKGREENEDDVKLPPDIRSALKKLDAKIEEGDNVSIRIYNGLQYELLEVFEKSKFNKKKYCVATKKMKRVRAKSKELEEDFVKERRKRAIRFAVLDEAPSTTSINPLNYKQNYSEQ